MVYRSCRSFDAGHQLQAALCAALNALREDEDIDKAGCWIGSVGEKIDGLLQLTRPLLDSSDEPTIDFVLRFVVNFMCCTFNQYSIASDAHTKLRERLVNTHARLLDVIAGLVKGPNFCRSVQTRLGASFQAYYNCAALARQLLKAFWQERRDLDSNSFTGAYRSHICSHKAHLQSLDVLQTAAHHEIKRGVSLAVSERLPAELEDIVYDWSLVAEEATAWRDTDLWDILQDVARRRKCQCEGLDRPAKDMV